MGRPAFHSRRLCDSCLSISYFWIDVGVSDVTTTRLSHIGIASRCKITCSCLPSLTSSNVVLTFTLLQTTTFVIICTKLPQLCSSVLHFLYLFWPGLSLLESTPVTKTRGSFTVIKNSRNAAKATSSSLGAFRMQGFPGIVEKLATRGSFFQRLNRLSGTDAMVVVDLVVHS